MPILIRTPGGAYIRYDSKYATDIDLCDCSCDDYPPGVCCCDDMGAILYMRIVQWEPTSECGLATVQVTHDVELSSSDSASVIDAGCGWTLADYSHDCMGEVWGGSWSGHYCNISGEYLEKTWFFALACLKPSLNSSTLSFGICMGSDPGGGGNYASLEYTDCPVDILEANYTLGLPFISLEIRRIPFAQW